ncbi:MAG: hypothetical protein RSE43_10755 [Oscillospiraceae bacterium]
MKKFEQKELEEYSFFRDTDGLIRYTAKCMKCRNICRQSFRVMLISCPIYEDNRKNKNTHKAVIL